MRIATYNVAWFTYLFDDDGGLVEDDGPSGRMDITREDQIAALSVVFRALDADAIMVIEGPQDSRRRDGCKALEGFAERSGLRARRAVMGFRSDTQQEIILLHDPDVMSVAHDPQGGAVPRFDESYLIDLDVDSQPDPVRWSKPPLELAVSTRAGRRFRMIGVHAKSKAPHGARSPEHATRIAIQNRRKQLAQCIWLRRRIDAHLEAGDDLIVLGDLNDGPGLDEFEMLFGRSGVEIVLGEDDRGRIPLFDPHARQARILRFTAPPATARFVVPAEGRILSALLDYIMISPGLRGADPRWRIWHPFDDPACYRDLMLREALLTGSDHFPVTLDIDI